MSIHLLNDAIILVRPYKIRDMLEEHRDVQKWVDGDIIFKNDFFRKVFKTTPLRLRMTVGVVKVLPGTRRDRRFQLK